MDQHNHLKQEEQNQSNDESEEIDDEKQQMNQRKNQLDQTQCKEMKKKRRSPEQTTKQMKENGISMRI